MSKRYEGRMTADGARRMGGDALTFTVYPQWHPGRYRVAKDVYRNGERAGGCLSFYEAGSSEDGAGIEPAARMPWDNV